MSTVEATALISTGFSNSCLYECRVMHARLQPKAHRFEYRVFMMYLDLDEIPALARRLWSFSHERFNVYAFRASDHFIGSAPSLKENIIHFAGQHGVDVTGGRVTLLTLPRIAGYIFNPVSFYFCFDRQGVPACAIAEVNNTFHETKPYFVPKIDAHSDHPSRFRLLAPKYFYVSPFSELDFQFEFKLQLPDDCLKIYVNDFNGENKMLVSSLLGTRKPLTDARLMWFVLKYPLLTLQVMGGIHYQALLLYLKKIPFHRKAANPTLQRDVIHPHHSIAGRTHETP